MTILAIDPGTENSAFVYFDGERVNEHGIEPNCLTLNRCAWTRINDWHFIAIESIESYGMAVGREVFETVWWTGRFYEAGSSLERVVARIPRKRVKLHLCGSPRATDANIRAALIDRFGGTVAAKGTKRAPGPLFGLKSHEWAALAVAVTWWDLDRPVEIDIPVTPKVPALAREGQG